MASGGSGGGKARKLAAALAQLEQEGGDGPGHAAALRWLVSIGRLTVDDALEGIAVAEDIATAICAGDVSKEQASSLAQQMALRHAGKRGPQ